eukprot:TRINITY_DN8679_c0_g1_i1.p1 TRINITY_DN8679_c0_g1~~TRINITY_DN8679_c0_g1_i1.p1  ORF type:complete len:445 (+),score=93.91 TRINITY_DN8679_c0_g1_i1:43-1335(+)
MELDITTFEENRKRFFDSLSSVAVVLEGADEKFRNADTELDFRQSSDFMFLTGMETTKGAKVVLDCLKKEVTLFVEFSESFAVWHGAPLSPETLKEKFRVDKVLQNSDLKDFLIDLQSKGQKIITLAEFSVPDVTIEHHSEQLRETLNELRAIKTEKEIQIIRKACQISCEAHVELMKQCRPGLNESQLESLFRYKTSWAGCKYQAYTPIVGSGENSTFLHYSDNNCLIKEHDFVLVDAGCENSCYASDITRTYPANGIFSERQKNIYNIVLRIQKKLIDLVEPGLEFKFLSSTCSSLLICELIQAGFIVSCTVEEAIEKKLDRIFMPHGLGHLLGLDVHDTTIYPKTPLAPNMVITIEPGVYFNRFLIEQALKNPEFSPFLDENLVREYLDVGGVRIEDVVVVTNGKADILSGGAPKEIEEIEALMKHK